MLGFLLFKHVEGVISPCKTVKWDNDAGENWGDEKITCKQYNRAFFMHIGEI